MKSRKILVLICAIFLLSMSTCAFQNIHASQTFTNDDRTIASCVGTLQTEGDLLVRSNGIREVFGASGKGVKVGVIGNGAESLQLSQTLGELGPVTVYDAGTGDEGTAMLEIIHDIAPDAELYFHAYGGNSEYFKQFSVK